MALLSDLPPSMAPWTAQQRRSKLTETQTAEMIKTAAQVGLGLTALECGLLSTERRTRCCLVLLPGRQALLRFWQSGLNVCRGSA